MENDVSERAFSAALRADCEPIFEAFWEHPAVAGLRDGTLPSECVLHYVGQDFHYLTAFMRCYGLGIAMSPDREWVTWFDQNIRFLLNDEIHPHHVLCRAVGVSYDEVQRQPLAPSAQAYIDHITTAGHDSLGVLMAALLPCPWTYIWAADRFVTETPPEEGHPFAGWWRFYASDDSTTLLEEFRDRVDRLATEAGPAERARMARAFELSARHEVRFWQMTWTREQ